MTKEEFLDELIHKHEIQSHTLLKVIQHPNLSEEEGVRASVARRFVMGFIDDLKAIKMKIEKVDFDGL